MLSTIKTLNQFIIERQEEFPYAQGELSRILSDIGVACKIIHREVNKAGLVNILGATGSINVQGEDVKKLDVFAHDQLIAALSSGGECCVVASEEATDYIPVYTEVADGAKYVVVFDPLDGSSNIDVNASIGTIFGVYRRLSPHDGPATLEDCLQKGSEQIAAGYVIYGSSTILVYTTGFGVNGFTYDPSIGEFCLSHPQITTPEQGAMYSINEGRFYDFSPAVQNILSFCKAHDPDTRRPWNSRYIGTLIADFHRNLLNGGIFMYPATIKNPNGKLRLIYEASPIAFLVEQAGGLATDGRRRIMDIQPTDLHQRTPLFIGSRLMVEKVMELLEQETVS